MKGRDSGLQKSARLTEMSRPLSWMWFHGPLRGGVTRNKLQDIPVTVDLYSHGYADISSVPTENDRFTIDRYRL